MFLRNMKKLEVKYTEIMWEAQNSMKSILTKVWVIIREERSVASHTSVEILKVTMKIFSK